MHARNACGAGLNGLEYGELGSFREPALRPLKFNEVERADEGGVGSRER